MRLKGALKKSLIIVFVVLFSALPIAGGVAGAAGLCNTPAFSRLGAAGCHGYFTGTNFQRPAPDGTVGDNVINCTDSSIGCVNGTAPDNALPFNVPPASCTPQPIPCGITNAATFEQFISWSLGAGYAYNHAGAAFIIDAMLGFNTSQLGGSATSAIAFARSHLAEWETDVNYYAAQPNIAAGWDGWIRWDEPYTVATGQVNSMHVCSTNYPGTCTRANINTAAYDGKDFVFFRQPNDEPSDVIEFRNPDGSQFIIRRQCANLIGSISALQVPAVTVTPNCGTLTVVPGRPDPNSPFTVRVAVDYQNNSQATSVAGSGDKMNMHVTGPGLAPYNNANVSMTQNGNEMDGTSASLGPTNNTGSYAVTWGITGPLGPAGGISCNGSFAIPDTPYFSVSGGDVSAGASMDVGGVNCATPADPNAGVVSWNQESPNYAGAGTQYAAFALNYLQDFATADTTPTASPTGTPTGLSFSNTDNVDTSGVGEDTYGGKLGSESCVPDYFGTHPATATYTGAHTFNTGTDLAGTGSTKTIYIQAGNLTINGAVAVPNGSHTIVYVEGNVQINGNIQFTGNYPGGTTDIPSFTIVASGNIYIAKSVSKLEGWYIAEPDSSDNGGIVYTCASGFSFTASDLKRTLYDNCNNQLKVNGSIVARQIWLTRTAGTLFNNTPAESFNFNPELWLSTPPGIGGGSSAGNGYDAITGLPPSL